MGDAEGTHFYTHTLRSGGQMPTIRTDKGAAGEGAAGMTPGQVTKFRNCKLLRGGEIVQDDLWVKHGKIIDPESRFWEAVLGDELEAADVVVDCKGMLLSPGFIDVQLNGAFGVDFTNAELTMDQGDKGSEGILKHGVTSYCPTVVTSSPAVYDKVLPLLAPAPGGAAKACSLGAHLEGPFICKKKKGAHDINLIRSPVEGFSSLEECYGSELERCAKIVTLAPELKGAIDAVKGLASRNIVASLGHTACDLAQANRAVTAGAYMITHMFNAMQSFHHRDPGLVGVLGSDPKEETAGVYYGIICDEIHCHPASVRIAYNASPKKVVLVTDAMMAMGLPPGQYPLGTMTVDITDRACIAGTDTLAGAIAPMDVCMRNFHKFTGCSVVEALEAASLHPAEVAGVAPKKGTLEVGADADLIFLNEELHVQACYVAGEMAWSNLDHMNAFEHIVHQDSLISPTRLTKSDSAVLNKRTEKC